MVDSVLSFLYVTSGFIGGVVIFVGIVSGVWDSLIWLFEVDWKTSDFKIWSVCLIILLIVFAFELFLDWTMDA